MYIDWKFVELLSIVLALAFMESHATLAEPHKRGRHQHQSYPTTTIAPPPEEENLNNKCYKEIPNVALKAYPHAKFIRSGSSMHMAFVETCCEGYQPHVVNSVSDEIACEPICDNCLNGYCVAPGECECYNGFVKNDNGDCVFTCPISCLNGQCYLDGTCKCHQGYKLDETKKFCRPICSEGCNGWMQNCTEPENCGCSTGYTLRENGCTPVCEPDCGLGGECVEPNKCSCHEDFNLKDGVCQADCYQKCDNGICFSKHRCICYSGFKYHEKTLTCIPT
ncbi:epidermal growth factor-like protein [Eupeodes corollae]|uniref:epidermal growth factor-like protein n=1 Tax=Eupeodes corollae TaxID=290404 RepID=UPI0024910859|nr:epidermal growth factor-like protein [Eupeodes corollae]